MGVDPGFKCTALVLQRDNNPVAAATANDLSLSPIQYRTWRMARWFQETIQAWIVEYEIQELHIVIEMPFLKSHTNNDVRGVTTLITQMRMIAAYEEACMRLQGCLVKMGTVSNTTAKSIFAGNGRADKTMMVAMSVWRKRPDVKEREHLADAQGIGLCYPTMVVMDPERVPPVSASYEDSAIGEGPNWKGKL